MQANVDIENWLSTKLESPWSSEKISNMLTPQILQQLKSRFSMLETPIKLRLLFSFITLRKKLKQELEGDISDILKISSEDEDEWVKVISKMLSVLLKEERSFSDLMTLDIEQFTTTVARLGQERK